MTYSSTVSATLKGTFTPVGVVSKLLRILELQNRKPAGLHLKDIAQLTDLDKSTVHRFRKQLEREEYLFRDDSGTYTVGPRLVRFGSGVSFLAILSRTSRPVVERLWRSTGETVNLATLAGKEILYGDVIENLHTFRLVSQIGSRRPLPCTSQGKAMLAAMSGEQREALLPTLRFESATPRSITTVARLRKDLARIVQLGYALDDEETVLGARCVAVAILDANGKIAGAIGVSGSTTRINKSNPPLIAENVKQTALEISNRLGYQRIS